MTKLYGSLTNRLMESAKQPAPVIGMAATVCMFTDRQAATVTAVSATGYKVTVQEDTNLRADANGMSESQTYTYTRNPDGRVHVFYRAADGAYRNRGGGLVLGHRNSYHDYSF